MQKKSFTRDMHYDVVQIIASFRLHRVYKFANNRRLHKFATANGNFEKSITPDMHHCITYTYINFQQNRVSTSVSPSKNVI